MADSTFKKMCTSQFFEAGLIARMCRFRQADFRRIEFIGITSSIRRNPAELTELSADSEDLCYEVETGYDTMAEHFQWETVVKTTEELLFTSAVLDG